MAGLTVGGMSGIDRQIPGSRPSLKPLYQTDPNDATTPVGYHLQNSVGQDGQSYQSWMANPSVDANPSGQAAVDRSRAFNTSLDALNALGSGSGGQQPSYVSPAAPPPAPHESAADSSAATRAALTQSKDAAGQRLAGGMKTLLSSLNGRGLVGKNSGIVAKGFTDLIGQNNAAQESTRAGLLAGDLERQQHVADQNLGADEGWADRQTGFNLASAGGENSFNLQRQQIANQARESALNRLVSVLQMGGY